MSALSKATFVGTMLAFVLVVANMHAQAAGAPHSGSSQPSAAASASPAEMGYTIVSGVPFGKLGNAGSPQLLADIYLPKDQGDGPFPGIVFIHGGGWRNGTRTQLRRQAQYMAARGMVGMAIDYRLAPAQPFPAAFDDAKQAVVWLRSHAAEYHVDSTRIAAVGSSAGGHLAALLGVHSDPRRPEPYGVQAVVSFNGIFDLAAMPPGTMVSDFLGKPCADDISLCHKASPIDQITSAGPSFLILHGTADTTAPYSQAEAFVAALKSAHIPVELFTAQDAPHTFWTQKKWLEPSFQAMALFLKHVFSPES